MSLRAEALQRSQSYFHQRVGLLLRFVYAEQGWIRCLLRCCIFTGGFSQLLGGLRHIQYIIYDLKRQTNRFSECPKSFNRVVSRSGIKSAAYYARRDQRGGFRAMNVLQHANVRLAMLSFEIDHLAANHSVDGTGTASYFFDDAHSRCCRATQTGQGFVCLGLQRVARQNGDSLAKNFVTCGPSATQIIIVQGGKVVVDERVGMQHLERCAQIFNSRWKRSGHHPASFQTENGPQSFAAGENTVPHGLVNGNGMLRGRRQQSFQGRVGKRTACLHRVIQHDAEYNKWTLELRRAQFPNKKDAPRRASWLIDWQC